jgi:hypothetical protein
MHFSRFIRNTFLFIILPFFVLVFIEFNLPLNFFTFRIYEAIKFNNESIPHIGPFYPNQSLSMKTVGDLCSHTHFEVKKNEYWKIDKLGFRNSTFVYNPDIVVFGSSFIYGTGLTQHHTFTEQLSRKLNKSVYNFAPYSINDFDLLVQKDSLKYPKIIVFSIGDWYTPSGVKANTLPREVGYRAEVKKYFYNGLSEVLDRCTRFYSFFWIKSRVLKKGVNYESPMLSGMFFGKGSSYKSMGANSIDILVNNMRLINEYCKLKKIKLYYIFTPSKELVYSDLIPDFPQNNFYSTVSDRLKDIGIQGVNSYSVFNEYRKKSTRLLYHKDDTHWNSFGVDLVTDELSKIIEHNK